MAGKYRQQEDARYILGREDFLWSSGVDQEGTLCWGGGGGGVGGGGGPLGRGMRKSGEHAASSRGRVFYVN